MNLSSLGAGGGGCGLSFLHLSSVCFALRWGPGGLGWNHPGSSGQAVSQKHTLLGSPIFTQTQWNWICGWIFYFFFFNASWVISWFTLKLLRALKNSGLKPGWLFCFLQSRVLGKVVSCRHVPLAALSRHSVGAATSHTLSVTNHLRERATCFKRGMMAVRGRSSWSAGSVWHLLRSWHGWVGSLNQHALCFSIVCFRSGIIKHQSKLYCCGYRKIRTLSRTSGSNKFVLYLISYLSQCQYETTSFYYINCI